MQVTAIDSVFDPGARRGLAVPPRSSIADMVLAAFPGTPNEVRRSIIVATINGEVVPTEAWAGVRPKTGTTVILKPVPQGDILRNVLTIAVTVAAIAAGQFYAPLIAPSLVVGTAGTQLAAAVITSTALLAGTLLINALVPARKDEKDKPTYAITGLQNQSTPDGVVPLVLGRVRYAPPYAARPYTQSVGDDRFVTASFCCGYGPLSAKEWRLGTTPLERFVDKVFEERQGLPGDPRLDLYPTQVLEEPLSIELQTPFVPRGGPQIRVTASDVTHCEIDTTYPGGVYAVNQDGETQTFTVVLATRYRPAGNPSGAWTAGPAIVVSSKKRKAITRTTRIDFPTRGRYEVELTRITEDWDEIDQSKKKIQRTGRSAWSVLRSFRPEYPIAFDKPLALAAIRIRATGQLNGVVDALNAEFCSICPDWDAASGTWITRETNNPASLFRYVLTGPAITYPLAEDEIAALGEWHAFCVAKGLTYNRVHDYEASVLDVLSDVAAAGRASPQNGGETWGVVIDRALDYVSAQIGPRNSWGFAGERPYVRFPEAFRVSFFDETNSHEKAERIVPWPGFVGDAKVVEKLDLPGVTNPDMVWRETRRRQYELIHRLDTYTVNQDWESLVVQRGDRVQLGHDVLDRAMVSARVRAVSGTQVVLDDEIEMEEGQSYAIRFRRYDGTSLLRGLRTIPGVSRVVYLDGAGDPPSAGNPEADPPVPPDLAFFGPASRETLACTIRGIEAMESMTARLTLVDHAPQVEALVDAEVPPPWSGRAGGEASVITTPPTAPTIGEIVSGFAAADYATAGNPSPILVPIAADPASPVPAATIEARHRVVGAPAWAGPVSAPVAAGQVVLPGYSAGQQVQIEPRALSAGGQPSPWGATVTHLVAGADPAVPVNLAVSVERRSIGPGVTAMVLRLTCDAPTDTTLVLAGRYRVVGASAWLDMARDGESLVSVASSVLSDGATYEAEGAISTPAGARRSAYIDATPSTITAVADTVAPAAPAYTSATVSGASVSHAVKQSPSANARAVQIFRAIGFDKTLADAVLAASASLSPNQADTISDMIDLGYHQWWARAANGSGVLSPAAGPRTALRILQDGNLLAAPTDFTAAAWSKAGVSAAASGVAVPDGSPASLISDTVTTGFHFIAQAVPVTSGGRYRAAMALRAAGRTRAALSLGDAAFTHYALVSLDLVAGTVASSTVGTLVTAPLIAVSKLPADWWLLTVTATVAVTSAQVRLSLRDDAGQSSYAGDTTKGVYAAAGTLAPV